MTPPSFRVRIALLSALLSGGMLLAAGLLFWELSDRMDLERIDREIRNLGSPQLDRVNGPSHWERFENALAFVAGPGRELPYIVRVRQDGGEMYRSPNWPPELDPSTLPVPREFPPEAHLGPGDPLPPPPRREPISPSNPALPLKSPRFLTVNAGGHRWRVGILASPYTTLALGADLDQLTEGTAVLRRTYVLALPLVLLMVGAGAWLLAARSLEPLARLTETVERITARGLDQRIPLLAHDRETQRLITVFNRMMDRLEAGFRQASRFSADAAHELKTPLTVLQGELELALQAAEPGSEQQRLFGRLIDDMARLRAITEKLLLLSQADAGALPLTREPVDFSVVVTEAVEDLGVLAPGLSVESQIAADLQVSGDPHLLAQVVQNLTTNAARYNGPPGEIGLSLGCDSGLVRLRVRNTGPGIPAADQERIFDRFYRAESSRSRLYGGTGLGLSLSREIARAHGGDLVLECSSGSETCFRLDLPAPPGVPPHPATGPGGG